MTPSASGAATATAVAHAPTIEASGVARSFGSVQAVRDATVSIQAGRVTALIGPNGCGKTTLLLMLAGLLQPHQGTIRVAGEDPVRNSAAVRDSVGWMPDQLGSWDNVTCLQNLTLMGRAYRLSAHDAAERGRELLDLVHLAEFADRPTRVLSRGQKQRLSLARALIHDPQVLLLDEPANGLDPRSRVELRQLVRSLAAAGKTVLVSSHVLAELDEMVDDAIFMSQGRTLGSETDTMVADARTKYRVEALDSAALHAALTKTGLAFEDEGESVLIRVADKDSAAKALAQLVKAGVAVHRFGPAGSALELTYMAMNEERR